MVSFELFARPSLLTMMGRNQTNRRTIWGLADEPFLRAADGKTYFSRVVAEPQADGAWHVRSAGEQGSHQLTAMARANALAIIPDGDGIKPGGRIRIMLLD